jgi:nitrite reductase (NADH) small subunit
VTAPTTSTTVWVDVCALADLVPDRGVAALVGRLQVAVFLVANETGDGELYALSNFDPFSQAFVLSRGIVGTRGDRLKVASPVYKQSFDLRTGECLDDPEVSVPVFGVRAVDGRVEVSHPSP